MSSSPQRGQFIVFEGIDGSGKSTQVRRLAQRLESEGLSVHTTFEPTKYRIGSILRRILTGQEHAHEATIAALFSADRLDHIHHPDYGMDGLLDRGTTVICDRYLFSSYAYNTQSTPLHWVYQLNAEAAAALPANLTIFLDLPPAVAMERIQQNRTSVDHYESLDTLQGVYDRYQQAFSEKGEPEKIHRIDAQLDMDAVSELIWERVAPLFTTNA